MMEQKLRWGILSTANIGRSTVIPAIQSSKNCEVVAVASRDAQKGTEFAARLGIPRSYGSYEALLDDPNIDAVYIPCRIACIVNGLLKLPGLASISCVRNLSRSAQFNARTWTPRPGSAGCF